MKKIYRYCLIGSLTLIGIACQDESLTSKKQEKPFDAMQDAERVDYAKENLLAIGNAAISLSREDVSFRQTIYSEIEKTFDGDYNVLIRTLTGAPVNGRREGKLYTSVVKVTGSAENAEQALTAFNSVEGKNYYPQIFIPFYEDLSHEGKIGVAEPMIVIAALDEPTYPGYKLDQEGKLVETGLTIDESYARENEVWVISINERADSDGNVSKDLSENGSGRTKGAYFPDARFEFIKCSMHKESWAAGGSEVHIKRYISFFNYDQFGAVHSGELTSEDDPGDGDGWRIYQFTRADVDANKKINRKWLYMSGWPTREISIGNGQSAHTDYLYYVIFEYDAWPAGLKVASIPDAGNSGNFIDTNFRSTETMYQMGYIPEGSANFWLLDKPGGFWAESWY
jgi:hypothetical protein